MMLPTEKLAYRYWIEWIEDQHYKHTNVVDAELSSRDSEPSHVIAGAHLGPGRYTLFVRVKDSDGNKSTKKALSIEIPTPGGYKRFTLITALLMGAVLGVI